MSLELRHLRYFVAVAHEGHITRAAGKLHMQQPPLSQQIRALEREIDAALFVRHPRGVALTDAGRSFLADAEAILAQVEHATRRAQRTARGETGRIAVGFTTSAPFHPVVARAIREFRVKRPDVSFVLEETGSGEEAVEAFQRHPADVVLIDIMLPGIDGFEVCRSIRRNSDVPIVMVTARADTHDVVAGLEAGADDYMTKPFAPKELSARDRKSVV